MICADEWNRLFSALEFFKIGFIGWYPPILHFSEKSVWLTCLHIYSQVRLKSCVLNTMSFLSSCIRGFYIVLGTTPLMF